MIRTPQTIHARELLLEQVITYAIADRLWLMTRMLARCFRDKRESSKDAAGANETSRLEKGDLIDAAWLQRELLLGDTHAQALMEALVARGYVRLVRSSGKYEVVDG